MCSMTLATSMEPHQRTTTVDKILTVLKNHGFGVLGLRTNRRPSVLGVRLLPAISILFRDII